MEYKICMDDLEYVSTSIPYTFLYDSLIIRNTIDNSVKFKLEILNLRQMQCFELLFNV